MLENGQYNLHWHAIYRLQEEIFLAVKGLKDNVLGQVTVPNFLWQIMLGMSQSNI
jgi:hypothetical protein